MIKYGALHSCKTKLTYFRLKWTNLMLVLANLIEAYVFIFK